MNVAQSSQDTYVFKQDYIVPARTQVVGIQQMRTFKKGESVVAVLYNANSSLSKIRFVPSILVDDTYIVPLDIVTRMRGTPAIKVGNGKDELINTVKNVSRGTGFKKGALLGAGAGVLYGFVANKSVFVSAIIGMVGGGVLGHIFIGKKAREAAVKAKLKEVIGDVKSIVSEAPRQQENASRSVDSMTLNRA